MADWRELAADSFDSGSVWAAWHLQHGWNWIVL
jgi:hypothetical protein